MWLCAGVFAAPCARPLSDTLGTLDLIASPIQPPSPGQGVALVIDVAVLAILLGAFDDVDEAPGACFDVDRGAGSAHVGLHPAGVEGEGGETLVLVPGGEAAGKGIERRLAGPVEFHTPGAGLLAAAQLRGHQTA